MLNSKKKNSGRIPAVQSRSNFHNVSHFTRKSKSMKIQDVSGCKSTLGHLTLLHLRRQNGLRSCKRKAETRKQQTCALSLKAAHDALRTSITTNLHQ